MRPFHFTRKRSTAPAALLIVPCLTWPHATWAQASPTDTITVTTTREAVRLWEVPASIGLIDGRSLRETAPAHPQQIMSQIPGVAVAVTNGEGHTTAIRQPFTTAPLYLFLEDGIPTRATGFFNHNALYEVNLPDAASIEVVRGPGSALYGSDAIGGLIHVITRGASGRSGGSANLEAGSHGWRRLLAAAEWSEGLRVSVNRTHTDGWREATGYDRLSLGLRWDRALGNGLRIKSILNTTDIDQQTGANTPLPLNDYLQNPRRNNFAIAFRQVQALRASTEWEWDRGPTLWTLTPYARANAMVLNGSFNLASDPRVEDTNVRSLGLLAKWRHDFGGTWKPRLIAGLDLEHSRGTRVEDALNTTRTGSGASTIYTAYTLGARIYDYAVDFHSLSPYAHLELQPAPTLRLTLGLRHDVIAFDMDNRITAAQTQAASRWYGQLPEARARFEQVSPKLGLSWTPARELNLFASVGVSIIPRGLGHQCGRRRSACPPGPGPQAHPGDAGRGWTARAARRPEFGVGGVPPGQARRPGHPTRLGHQSEHRSECGPYTPPRPGVVARCPPLRAVARGQRVVLGQPPLCRLGHRHRQLFRKGHRVRTQCGGPYPADVAAQQPSICADRVGAHGPLLARSQQQRHIRALCRTRRVQPARQPPLE
jgi:outer membrane receptor protein involved in Fe transport